jgi:hypothetical protein
MTPPGESTRPSDVLSYYTVAQLLALSAWTREQLALLEGASPDGAAVTSLLQDDSEDGDHAPPPPE